MTPETQTFKGDPGAPGADGATPAIGENGNWWIGGKDTGKPARGPQGEPGDVPVLSTTFTAQDAGKAADAKAVGDKIADDMTKVTTLKINDEWRFSVAPGLSGSMAIRLEHLDFPAQGIWGVYTEMSIPTGLGTLAKSADIPKISTTFTEQDAGKAADAKAVGEKFAEQFGHISSIGNLASNADGKADTALNAAGWADEKANNALTAAGEAKESVTDATKLTPVLDADGHVTGYKLGDKASPVLLTDDAKAALFAGADFSRACAYKIVTVGADGMMTDRAINATSAASVTVPDDYTDLLIRASVTGSLSVTVPDGVTKYGDSFPAETGEYIVTITKLTTGEAFVKTLKLEVANA